MCLKKFFGKAAEGIAVGFLVYRLGQSAIKAFEMVRKEESKKEDWDDGNQGQTDDS